MQARWRPVQGRPHGGHESRAPCVARQLRQALVQRRPVWIGRIIGWQAPHTLGRQIVERRPYVRIFDYDVPLKAHVEVLNGLSAHADADDLKWWFGEANRRGHIGKAFLVHGEPEAAKALALAVRDDCDEDPVIPQLYESFEV